MDNASSPSRSLVASLRRSSEAPAEYAAVYRRFRDPLLRFFVRRTFDAEASLDLCAETLAQAFESRRRFRGGTDEDLAAWIWGIARKKLARFARKGVTERRASERLGLRVPRTTADDVERIHELAGLDSIRGALIAALDQLPVDQRRAIKLRVIDELEYGDVADRLAVSEATARARVSRGLRRLGEVLEPVMRTEEVPT